MFVNFFYMYYIVLKIIFIVIEIFVNCGNFCLCNEFFERIILLVCICVNLIKGFIIYSYVVFDILVIDKKCVNIFNLI